MSDEYGIGDGLAAYLEARISRTRGMGKTTNLIKRSPPNACIITHDPLHARRLEQQAIEENREDIKVISVAKGDLDRVYHNSSLQGFKGPIVFDHHWVESYFLKRLERASKDLFALRSIYSKAHKEQDPLIKNLY